MRIGIAGPVNPEEFRSYFPNQDVPRMNLNASSVQALVKSFLENGHTVFVFTVSEHNKYQEFISDNLKVFAVPYRLIPKTSIFQIYKVQQLRKCIRKHISEIDVIHAQWTYEYAYSAKAFAKEIPVFCTVRDWCPYIMSVVCKSMLGKIGWSIKYVMFRRVMANDYVHFIANSEYTKSRIIGDYPNLEVVVIPNSIKREYIIKNKETITDGIRLITIANGINDPRKNIVNLLKAFKKLRLQYPQAFLTIVGKFNENHPDFIQWEEEGLFENVILTGQLRHEEVIAQIDKSSIMIHPSLEETFGNILLEAMARRVPVIGGIDSGAVPMVLGHGEYGLCCDVKEPDEVLQAIVALLDERKEKELVDRATNHLLDTFASDVVCRKHIKVFSNYIKDV